MTPSLFPDVNVWLALSHERHAHHRAAAAWFNDVHGPCIFCRFTQLGFLRLLTNEQVMGVDVLDQRGAWQIYKRWFEDDRIEFYREPEGAEFEETFEKLATTARPSPKLWADAYLAAFAHAVNLTLVTFDKAFARISFLGAQVLPAAQGR